MFKILLVDDEPRQLKALSNVLQKLRPLDILETADDGQMAYGLLIEGSFDILITDIKMANMDGLELIEKLGDMRQKLKIVIISGFADFNYAQRAMAFGVKHYLVKPIKKNELEETLNTIEQLITSDLEQKKEATHLQKQLKNSLPVYMEHQWHQWIAGKMSAAELEEMASIFPFRGKGVVLFTKLIRSNDSTDDSVVLGNDLKELSEAGDILPAFQNDIKMQMKKTLDLWGHSLSFFLKSERDVMVSILNTDQSINLYAFDNIRYLKQYLNDLKRDFNIDGTIGVSEMKEDIFAEVATAYIESKNASKWHFFKEMSPILYARDLKDKVLSEVWHTEALENDLLSAINEANKIACTKLVWQVFETVVTQLEPQFFKEQWTLVLFHLSKTLKNSLPTGFVTTFNLIVRTKIERSPNLTSLKNTITSLLYDLLETLKLQREDINQVIISKSQVYLETHYDESISLDQMAQKYHFNTTYFCNLFKEYTGVSFSKYLTKVRINQAIQLLVSTEAPMIEIAQKVGIQDPAYFNRIFKKETGVSPNKYRQMNATQKER